MPKESVIFTLNYKHTHTYTVIASMPLFEHANESSFVNAKIHIVPTPVDNKNCE